VLEAHVGCPSDVATIGVPVASAPADVHAAPIVEVAVSREGCTIAALTATSIAISFDGGKSFAKGSWKSATQMVAADGRVMLLDGEGRLCTMQPGHPGVCRSLPGTLAGPSLFAAGTWTVLAGGKLAGISDDNGETWRYIDLLPELQVSRVDADGRLYGTQIHAIDDPSGDGPGAYTSMRFVTDLAHPHWRALDTATPGTPADESGRYVLDTDKFWGCGGSQKLELAAHGHVTEVAGDLRDEVWPIRVHTTAGVTFASLANRLVRIDGATVTDRGEMPDGELVGVDAKGAPIVRAGSQLLRWSKAGGWRVLL
jgi:hypothetical protein